MSAASLYCKYCGIYVSEWNMGGVDTRTGQLICKRDADKKNLPPFLPTRNKPVPPDMPRPGAHEPPKPKGDHPYA